MKKYTLLIQLLLVLCASDVFAGLLSGLLRALIEEPPKPEDYSNTKCKRTCYRSYNGSCNNLKHPHWGAAGSTFTRLFDSYSYKDGKCEMVHLTSPRKISLDFVHKPKVDPIWTLYTPMFGQMLAHDMTLASGAPQSGAQAVSCPCVGGKLKDTDSMDARCAPIKIPKWDPYNTPEGVECYDFVRTRSTCDENTSSPGEQYNAVTSTIDCSPIYGNNEEQANKLRRFKHGMLDYVIIEGRMYPPQAKDPSTCNTAGASCSLCIVTGDVRANQNTHITLMQIIWLRCHNKIAKILCKKINKHWNDEKCYQETRRIIIALFQHFTYDEYLPFVLGEKNMEENGMYQSKLSSLLSHEKGYDDKVNPSAINEHSTAAFRLFHTTIVDSLKLYDEKRKPHGVVQLGETFNNGSVLLHRNTEMYMAIGAGNQPQMAVDHYYSFVMTQGLFPDPGEVQGQDLLSIDIQRSRDHGLANFITALEKCGICKITCFDDFNKVMPPEHVEILKRHYKNPEDVELIVGGILEPVPRGQLSGETFNCIMCKQFKKLKFGDYYFYEFKQKCSFTKDQLEEIKKTKLAKVICDHTGNYPIQPKAFELPSSDNEIGDCDDLHFIDLEKWEEDSSHSSKCGDD